MSAMFRAFGAALTCKKSVVRLLMGLLSLFLITACGSQTPREETLEIHFRDVSVEPGAVSKILPLVSASHQPDQEHLSPEFQSLFTYLARAPTAQLATTPAHSQGIWQVEKVFVLDDCVAVQLSEGHYLETLFFSQYSKGWRLAARIRPQDHE